MKSDASPVAEPVLAVRDLVVRFPARRSLLATLARRPGDVLVAVDGITLELRRGEILGLVGESGSGKTTVAKCIVGLQQPDAGSITLAGKKLLTDRSLDERRRVQIVFQNPYTSLNPRLTVGRALREVIAAHHRLSPAAIDARSVELLAQVALPRHTLSQYPRHLSGGQRQRVAIARALATEPDVLVADEPVSALDVSVQAMVLELIQRLRSDLGLSILLISHDLSVVRHVSDRVAVMYLGRVVELAASSALFDDPRHPYTKGLLAAVPRLVPGRKKGPAAVQGLPPSPYRIPTGCRFRTRCPLAAGVCEEVDPALTGGKTGVAHVAACHFAWNS